jgi:hypothetical protein
MISAAGLLEQYVRMECGVDAIKGVDGGLPKTGGKKSCAMKTIEDTFCIPTIQTGLLSAVGPHQAPKWQNAPKSLLKAQSAHLSAYSLWDNTAFCLLKPVARSSTVSQPTAVFPIDSTRCRRCSLLETSRSDIGRGYCSRQGLSERRVRFED